MAGILESLTGGTPGLMAPSSAYNRLLGTGWDYGWQWGNPIAERPPGDIFSTWQFGGQMTGAPTFPVVPAVPVVPEEPSEGLTEGPTWAGAGTEGGSGGPDIPKNIPGDTLERDFPYGWESDYTGPTGAPFVPGLDWDASVLDIANTAKLGLGFPKGIVSALPVLGGPFADPGVQSILDEYEKQYGLPAGGFINMVNEAYGTEPAKSGGILGSILSPLTGLFNPPEYGYNTVRGLLMSYENGPFANYADAFTDYERIVGGTIVRGPDTVSADKLAGLFDAYAKGMQRAPSPYEVKDFARLAKLNPTWAENRIRMISTGAVEDTRPSPGSVDVARAAWDGAISPTDPTKSIGDVIGGWLSGDPSVTTKQAEENLKAYQDIKALTEMEQLAEAIPSLAPMEPKSAPKTSPESSPNKSTPKPSVKEQALSAYEQLRTEDAIATPSSGSTPSGKSSSSSSGSKSSSSSRSSTDTPGAGWSADKNRASREGAPSGWGP